MRQYFSASFLNPFSQVIQQPKNASKDEPDNRQKEESGSPSKNTELGEHLSPQDSLCTLITDLSVGTKRKGRKGKKPADGGEGPSKQPTTKKKKVP
jgi:hypothetical protein